LPMAAKVLTSKLFEPGTGPGAARCDSVGVPLRSALRQLAGRRPEPPAGRIRLLVLGGSLGCPFLNARAAGLAHRLVSIGIDLCVTHQCGRSVDPTTVLADYQRAGVRAEVRTFFDPIAPVLAAADFVLTAAGAVTLHEIAAAGVPLLIRPLRVGAGAHQIANAEVFARATGCLSRTAATWDERETAGAIAAILGDPERWRRQSLALQAFVAGNACAEAVDRIVASLPARALRA
jgi:UDP-N-acetylglucosamine--N-acetylmuramyl-(pentapeptide) pyrophosphoryl-undecaprenol N-acetylglucosamine transferase